MDLVDDNERDVTDKVPGLPGAGYTVPLLGGRDNHAGPRYSPDNREQ